LGWITRGESNHSRSIGVTVMSTADSAYGILLILNAGSSSIKFAIYHANIDVHSRLAYGEIEGIGTAPRFHARDCDGMELAGPAIGRKRSVHELMASLIGWIEARWAKTKIMAAGHRVVLGGLEHTTPVLIDAGVLERLRELIPLAPVHQPRNLEPVEALAKLNPDMPQVACFDTAFHRTMPEVAQLYGLPKRLTEAGGRRYGFHGLSYEYVASVLPEIDDRAAKGRTVIAHLGNGASMCALVGGRSVATTMGFSPLSGLLMGTRPGELDPGLLLWLTQAKGMPLEEVETMLYHECGLKGVSGLSSDMRDLLASDDPQAKLAIDLFVYRVCWELGALAAAAQGLDALVFTGGIGEHAAAVRQAVCRQSRWLGIDLDTAANARGDRRISSAASSISVWVIPTDEERMIARHTWGILQKLRRRVSDESGKIEATRGRQAS
jgi:acetate kinase